MTETNQRSIPQTGLPISTNCDSAKLLTHWYGYSMSDEEYGQLYRLEHSNVQYMIEDIHQQTNDQELLDIEYLRPSVIAQAM